MGALGERMKALEHTTRAVLPRHTNMVIRVDGRAFHSFTRGLERPFDPGFVNAMNETAMSLCQEVQGAVCTSQGTCSGACGESTMHLISNGRLICWI